MPIPPMQPSLTHAGSPDPDRTIATSVQFGLGFPELGRNTLGVSYTPSRSVALGIEATWSGPYPQLYGRPTLVLYFPWVALVFGGSVGAAAVTKVAALYFGGDLTLRIQLFRPSHAVQAWVGISGSYTAPIEAPNWLSTGVAGLELGIMTHVSRTTEVGFLLYGLMGSTAPVMPYPAVYDFAMTLAVRFDRQLAPPKPPPPPLEEIPLSISTDAGTQSAPLSDASTDS